MIDMTETAEQRLIDLVAEQIAAAAEERLRQGEDEFTRGEAAARNAAGWTVTWLRHDALAALPEPPPFRAVVRLASDQLDRAWLRAHELVAERLV